MFPTRAHALLALLALLAACQDQTTSPGLEGSSRTPHVQVRTGFLAGLGGRAVEVGFEVKDGLAVWQGDIILGRVSEIATSPAQLAERIAGGAGEARTSLGVALRSTSRRWPGGVVPYEIDPALSNPARIAKGIALVEKATAGVTLVPRSGQADYVRFVPSDGCSSHIGRIGGPQFVWLAGGCEPAAVAHEILHALGMLHEQSRCDRYDFVQIDVENILPGMGHNFATHCGLTNDLGSYSEGSLMHYPRFAFTRNGKPTIVSRRGLDRLMGQREGLSESDAATVDLLYPPPPPPLPPPPPGVAKPSAPTSAGAKPIKATSVKASWSDGSRDE